MKIVYVPVDGRLKLQLPPLVPPPQDEVSVEPSGFKTEPKNVVIDELDSPRPRFSPLAPENVTRPF